MSDNTHQASAGATYASDVTNEEDPEYFDMILVGTTGLGKSTLGNRLLNFEKDDNSLPDAEDKTSTPPRFIRFLQQGFKYMFKGFKTADDVEESEQAESVTKSCQLAANKVTTVRVLDTPGFSTTDSRLRLFDANLQIFRWIVREQIVHNMEVKRILYFLPHRGAGTGKANKVLQQELEIMYHFFGTPAFELMVLIATQEELYQEYSFTEVQCRIIEKAFCTAVTKVTDGKVTTAPPLVYFGLNDQGAVMLKKIQEAPVSDHVFKPVFRDDICARCSCQIRFTVPPSGECTAVGIVRGDTLEKYDESKCHPSFISKYSQEEKLVGGLKHCVTFGFVYLHEGEKNWPWFFNSEEFCPQCHKLPGSDPCLKVNEKFNSVKVRHSNEL